ARDIVFGQAGVTPEDVDVTGSYDAFTFTTMLQLEEYGFCVKGEGGAYLSSGIIELGGRRPNNTSGGHLCEGYTHGMSMVIENVRQLRGTVDDYCPDGREGKHSYDYAPGWRAAACASPRATAARGGRTTVGGGARGRAGTRSTAS